jgi:tetratricopeptide (TPR) repeat protein
MRLISPTWLTILFSASFLLLFSCEEKPEKPEQPAEIQDYTALDGDKELARINSLLESEPNNAELLAQKADILFKLYRQEEGLNDISKAFRIDSTNLEVRRVHAGYMMAQVKILAARDDYQFIIEKDPGNAEAYLGMARTYAVENNHAKAFQYTDEALKRNMKLRDAYVLKGLMFRSDNKIDLAISSYQTAVEIDPNYYSGYVALGNLYEIKQSPLALDYYNTALEIEKNGIEALYGKALLLQNSGKIKDAQDLYRKISQVEPDYYFAYYNQGYIKLVLETEYDSATYFFTKTVEIAPLYADAWYNLGLSEQARGKNREAIKAFKETLSIDKNFTKAQKEIDAILKMK